MNKPILYDLVAWVFPGVIEWEYAHGKRDEKQERTATMRGTVIRHMSALQSFHSISMSENVDGSVWYSVYVDPPGPETAND